MSRHKKEAYPERAAPPAGRPNRVPVGRRDVLAVPEHLKKPGFKYRFVNDDENRFDSFRQAGWGVVTDTQVGDENVGQATQLGSVAGKPVGGGKRAVLMAIPSEYWEEDQAAKEAQIKENLGGLLRDDQGRTPDQNPLVYGEGISIKRDKTLAMPVISED
jgi:hypothetical protein